MKKILIAAFVTYAGFAAPAFAIIDDGSGCGCIRPCPWIVTVR